MTAAAFDPEAIARRVFDREHAAVDEHHEPSPPVVDTHYVPGTGKTRGRPLPTVAEGDGSDIFDRLERQREAKRVRSPFALRDVPFEPTARTSAERAATEGRFRAPSLQADLEELERSDPDVAAAAASYDAMSERIRAKHRGDSARSMDHEPPTEPAHDPRCGEILSGGGAPRGWVLVRVIGSGTPRRYCSPECAVQSLTFVEPAGPVQPKRRRQQHPLTDEQRADAVRRYEAGQSIRDIVTALDSSYGGIQSILAAAGVQLRTGGGGPAQAAVSARLRELHIKPRQVKEWAVEQGLVPAVVRGNPRRHLIDAYLAAHQNGAST